jgi:hypothetical protein
VSGRALLACPEYVENDLGCVLGNKDLLRDFSIPVSRARLIPTSSANMVSKIIRVLEPDGFARTSTLRRQQSDQGSANAESAIGASGRGFLLFNPFHGVMAPGFQEDLLNEVIFIRCVPDHRPDASLLLPCGDRSRQ